MITRINYGTRIYTCDGYVEIISLVTDNMVRCGVYEIIGYDIWDEPVYERAYTTLLTFYEISQLYKDNDGMIHKIVWE